MSRENKNKYKNIYDTYAAKYSKINLNMLILSKYEFMNDKTR